MQTMYVDLQTVLQTDCMLISLQTSSQIDYQAYWISGYSLLTDLKLSANCFQSSQSCVKEALFKISAYLPFRVHIRQPVFLETLTDKNKPDCVWYFIIDHFDSPVIVREGGDGPARF